MIFIRSLLPVLLILPAIPAAADTLTDLLPPDAKVVFGIRVHNLALSSLAPDFAAQAQTAAAAWLKTVPLDGVNMLRDIDEVLIASPCKEPETGILIVFAGRFDLATLAQGANLYHGIAILDGPTDSDPVVAFLDAGTALAGSPALVHAAIERRGGKKRIDATLNDRITSLRQRYDVWGLGAQPEGFTAPVPEAKVVESIDRFQFGLQLVNGLELAAEIHPRSGRDAATLHEDLDAVAALLKGLAATPEDVQFDVQADGTSWKVSASMPEAELKKAVETQAALAAPTVLPAAPPTAAPEPVDDWPSTLPEPAPAPPAAAPAIPPPVPAPAPVPAAAKPAAPDPHDTVVLTLPGKK